MHIMHFIYHILLFFLDFNSYIFILLVYKLNMNIKSDIYFLTVDMQQRVQGEHILK